MKNLNTQQRTWLAGLAEKELARLEDLRSKITPRQPSWPEQAIPLADGSTLAGYDEFVAEWDGRVAQARETLAILRNP